jgi:hypothetical protein
LQEFIDALRFNPRPPPPGGPYAVEQSIRLARDAFYVTVGFGVIIVQKAQVRRRELAQQAEANEGLRLLRTTLEALQHSVEAQAHELEHRVTQLEARVDQVLDQVEGHLPEPTREVVHQARDAARTARHQLLELVLPHGGATAN